MAYIVKGTSNADTPDFVYNRIENLNEAIEIAEDELQNRDDFMRMLSKEEYEALKTEVIDQQNGLIVWSSDFPDALKKYLEYDHEQWQGLECGHHEQSDKSSVYFDIDGTLGKWYSDGRGLSLEEMIDPSNHYFRNIEPVDMMINLAQYLHENGADVCIVSAAYKDTIIDKWDWIKEHLPFIPDENICFAPIGADKTEFVKGNAEKSILIDDYNKNLEEWKGISLKALNGINSHQEIYGEIDFSDWKEKLKNARELSLEYDTDEIIEKATMNAFNAVKYEGEKILSLTNEKELQQEYQLDYQLLNRLKSDCDYYLGYGNKNDKDLWAKNPYEQIKKMEELYDKLPVKPEWLTREEIQIYAEKMNVAKKQKEELTSDDLEVLSYYTEDMTLEEIAYESYKKVWVMEHISPTEWTATIAEYENSEETEEMSFREYIEEYGFADGSCYSLYDEFCDDEAEIWVIANRFENFLWECGEYEYSADETPQWIDYDNKWSSTARLETTSTIAQSIDDEKFTPMIDYIEAKIMTMSEHDELVSNGEGLLDALCDMRKNHERETIKNKTDIDLD